MAMKGRRFINQGSGLGGAVGQNYTFSLDVVQGNLLMNDIGTRRRTTQSMVACCSKGLGTFGVRHRDESRIY